MNISFKKALAAVVILVLIIAGAYAYVNYSFINGSIVSNDDVTYANNEAMLADSYDSGDVNAQVEAAQKLQASGINKEQSDLDLATSLLNQGSLQFDEETKADAAMPLLNGILSKDPNNAEAVSALGYAYEIKQDYQKAIQYYNQSLGIDPSIAVTYDRRGHAFELSGDYPSAQADYLKAYSIDPSSDATLMNLARMYFSTNDYPDAVKFANATLDVTTNNYTRAVASEVIGQVAIKDKEYDLAQQYFNYSITSDPTYPGPYLQYAFVNIIRADAATSSVAKDQLLTAASDDISTAIKMHPDTAYGLMLTGLVQDERNQPADAQATYRQALAVVDTDITLGAISKDAMRSQLKTFIK